MSSRTGPVPALRSRDQRGTYRIQFRVAQGLPQMGFIQRTGIVSPLPNMPCRMVYCVPVGSESAVGLLQRPCQYIALCRDGDKVDVVCHQAVADYCYAVKVRTLPQQIEVDFPIRLFLQDKDKTPSVAALSYVVGNSDRDYTSEPRR